MFRFTIRDLLWLTVVVAFACGWFLERRNSYEQREYIRMEHETLEKKRQQIDMLDNFVSHQLSRLQNETRRLGIKPLVPPIPPGSKDYGYGR